MSRLISAAVTCATTLVPGLVLAQSLPAPCAPSCAPRPAVAYARPACNPCDRTSPCAKPDCGRKFDCGRKPCLLTDLLRRTTTCRRSECCNQDCEIVLHFEAAPPQTMTVMVPQQQMVMVPTLQTVMVPRTVLVPSTGCPTAHDAGQPLFTTQPFAPGHSLVTASPDDSRIDALSASLGSLEDRVARLESTLRDRQLTVPRLTPALAPTRATPPVRVPTPAPVEVLNPAEERTPPRPVVVPGESD